MMLSNSFMGRRNGKKLFSGQFGRNNLGTRKKWFEAEKFRRLTFDRNLCWFLLDQNRGQWIFYVSGWFFECAEIFVFSRNLTLLSLEKWSEHIFTFFSFFSKHNLVQVIIFQFICLNFSLLFCKVFIVVSYLFNCIFFLHLKFPWGDCPCGLQKQETNSKIPHDDSQCRLPCWHWIAYI